MSIEDLINKGIDYEDGLKRFIDNKDLYEKYLRLFITNNDFNKAKRAVEEKSYQELFEYIHAMKGVTGNLSLRNLYNMTCEFTEKLRAKDYSNVENEFNKLYKEYERNCNILKEYFGI